MSTFYTDLAAIQNEPTGDNRLKKSQGVNSFGAFIAIYTLLATEVATDIIRVCKLHKDDIIDISNSSVFAQNPGTTLAFDVGDNDGVTPDIDRYVDGLDISAGGNFAFLAGATEAAVAVAPYQIVETQNDDTWLEVLLTGAATLTVGQKIAFYISIKKPNG